MQDKKAALPQRVFDGDEAAAAKSTESSTKVAVESAALRSFAEAQNVE
jgi:hypothetical protein